MGLQFFESLISVSIFVFTSIFLLYCWFQYKFTYWAKKGVPGPTPTFPFGNIRDVLRGKIQLFEPYVQSYWKYRDLPYVGMYFVHQPALCVNDPDLAKNVLIKDFDHFQGHAFFQGGTGEPMTDHMFNLHGTAWKNLRVKMSPTFSQKTLKSMYNLIDEIANEAASYVDLVQATEGKMNFSKFYSKYTMEIISSVGFGVKSKGFTHEDSEFYQKGIEFFNPPKWYRLVRFMSMVMPSLFDILQINRYDPKLESFFVNIVSETVKYREENNYSRNDFLQALIELYKQSKKGEVDGLESEFTINHIVANSMLYMVAGFDTSSTMGHLAAYHLAIHPEIQEKARREVKQVLSKYDGQCTYEAQNEMVYLNMVFDETMRLFPPMRALNRVCTKEYVIPNTDIVIEEGTRIFIPVHGIQKDPKIYPDPEKFDPERFNLENKSKLHPCYWMPFGEGPRKCIGLRQGYTQAKIALVKVLDKYELSLDEKTKLPLEISALGLSLSIKNGIWLKMKPISRYVKLLKN